MATEELKVAIGVSGAKEFKNQLKDINGELKESDKQFKETEKQAKLLENGMDGVESQLKALDKVMESQNKKCKLYEDRIQALTKEQKQLREEENKLEKEIKNKAKALDEAKKSYGDNSDKAQQLEKEINKLENQLNKTKTAINKNVSEHNKLQRELTTTKTQLSTTEAKVNSLQRELKNFKTDSAEKELKELEDSADDSSEAIQNMTDVTSKVSDKIGGFFTACYDQYMSAEESIMKIQGTMGVTRETAEEVYDSVLELSSKGFDFDEAQESVIRTKQVLGDLVNGEELPKMSEKVLKVSRTFDEDMGDIIRACSTLMRNFGINSDEALDIITKGFQDGNNVAGDWLDTLSEDYPVAFKSVGYDAKDMLNIITNGMKEGTFSTDKMADALKEGGIRLREMNKASAEAVKSLGLNANTVQKNISASGETARKQMTELAQKILEVKDPVKQNEIGVALLGTQYEDLGIDGVKALANVDKETKDVKGSSDELKSGIGGIFGEENAGKMANIKKMMGEIGQQLAPIVGKILDLVGAVAEFAQQHPVIMQILTVVLFIVGILTTIVTIGGSVIMFLAGLSVALGTLGISVNLLSAPVLLVIAGIVALIAILVLLWLNWDEVVDWCTEKWGQFCDWMSEKLEQLKEWFREKWQWIEKNMIDPVEEGVQIVCDWFSDLYDDACGIVDDISSWIKEKFDWIKENMVDPIADAVGSVISWFNRLKNKISDVWSDVKGFMADLPVVGGFFNSNGQMDVNRMETRESKSIMEVRSTGFTRPAYGMFSSNLERAYIPNLGTFSSPLNPNIKTASALYTNNAESRSLVDSMRGGGSNSSHKAISDNGNGNLIAELTKQIQGLGDNSIEVKVFLGEGEILEKSYNYTVNKINRKSKIRSLGRGIR